MLIDAILGWLQSLPGPAVYAVLGVLAIVENIVPPVPADAAVLLGAFLSQRGVTTPLGVFLVVWSCNVAGALAVYQAARTYGRRLFETPGARRLLAPEAIGVIEREYLRFGVLGIFLARFLPGIRAVVPPFAGLVNLSPARAAIPIAAASAVWYGGITVLGALLGAQWSRLVDILSRVNRTLAYVALVVAAVWIAAVYLRARRRRRERVWEAVTRALGTAPAAPGGRIVIDPRAAAMLVLELAYADEALRPEDRALVAAHLRAQWGLEPPLAPQPAAAPAWTRARDRLRQRFGRPQRLALVEEMWHAAFRDGTIGAQEERVMERAAELLGLTPDEVAAVRARARAGTAATGSDGGKEPAS